MQQVSSNFIQAENIHVPSLNRWPSGKTQDLMFKLKFSVPIHMTPDFGSSPAVLNHPSLLMFSVTIHVIPATYQKCGYKRSDVRILLSKELNVYRLLKELHVHIPSTDISF
jgi:hypothetical protein